MLMRLNGGEIRGTGRLLGVFGNHLALRALLAGAVPGEIYADATARPRAALAWVQQRLWLAGEADPEAVRRTLADGIGPRLTARGVRHSTLYPAAGASALAWQGTGGPAVVKLAQRQYYERTLGALEPVAPLPEGYTLRPVDANLLNTPGLGHLEALREELCSERPSAEAFLRESFGVCALHSGALAGWCLSEYNFGGAFEVGIETLPDHRGRGLATAMTLALAGAARDRGYERVGWHCYADNEASGATARAAGLRLVETYEAAILAWPEYVALGTTRARGQ